MALILFSQIPLAGQATASVWKGDSPRSQKSLLTVHYEKESLADVLQELAQKVKVGISYETEIVPNIQVSYQAKNRSIFRILGDILEGTGLQAALSKNRKVILIKKKTLQGQIVLQTTIIGTVTDAQTGETLPGVNILVKGTSTGASTDANGQYELEVESLQDTLVVSFVGYKTQQIPIEGRTEIDVAMQTQAISGQEMVVVGYGTQEKKDLTGSITKVKAKTFQNQNVTQLSEILAGRVAGLSVSQGTGADGGGSSIEIRGANSILASTSPMIVIDGAVYDGSLRDINPTDIESVDILKGASATAVYGARAASGVIAITTKKGKVGKPKISFSSRIGTTQPTKARREYGPDEYIQFRADYLREISPGNPYSYYTNPDKLPKGISLEEWRNYSDNPLDDNIQEYLTRLQFKPTEKKNYENGKTTDWYDVVMRNGMRQKYDLSISGGSDQATYFWSIGYNTNEGMRVGSKFSTLRSRLNVDYNVTDWLDVGLYGQYANKDERGVPASLSFFVNSPYGSVYTESGDLKRLPNDHTLNPLLDHYLQTKFNPENSFFANSFANVSLPLGINYKLSFHPRFEFSRNFNFRSTNPHFGGDPSQDQSTASRNRQTTYGWIVENILKWKKQFGISEINATFLYQVEKYNTWSDSTANKNFKPNESLGFHGIQFGDTPYVSSNDTEVTGNAILGRINYTLLDKYLLTASLRSDGYSAFGQKEPKAYFPSIALAWRVSNEKFFNLDFVNNLKLRLSWGANGNRSVGAYSALGQVSSNLWFDGSSTHVGTYSSNLANPNLAWERTESYNIGLDIGLLDNRIGITVDAYSSSTKDLLLNRRLPSLTGFDDVTTNLGKLGNRGIELTLNTTNIRSPKITWNSNFVFSLNRNKIKSLYGDIGTYKLLGNTHKGELPDFQNEWFTGHALDAVWNYNLLGIWQEDSANEADRYGLRPGDFRVKDVNNDGIYSAKDDKQFIGYTKPRYSLGLSNQFSFLGNWTASFFIRAQLGYIGAIPGALNPGEESDDRQNRNVNLPYWTPQNSNNSYARLAPRLGPFGGGLMKYVSRSYLRLQNASLSYNLSSSVAKQIHLTNVRIFASARNLATITKWPLWDPESGDTPMPKIYTVGINLSL